MIQHNNPEDPEEWIVLEPKPIDNTKNIARILGISEEEMRALYAAHVDDDDALNESDKELIAEAVKEMRKSIGLPGEDFEGGSLE